MSILQSVEEINGMSVARAARAYWTTGLSPVPVAAGGKKGILEGPNNGRLTEAELDRHFPAGTKLNVGLRLGGPSRGLVDVDLDCPEAVLAAAHLLPPTGWMSGRTGTPPSHYWYKAADPPDKASESYLDLSKKKLIELRSTGGLTVVPPSVREDAERVVWHTPAGRPGQVEIRSLRTAVRRVAAAALLARHWVEQGSRHDAHLALAGGLAQAGWTEAEATSFVAAVAAATNDEEPRGRARNVASTFANAAEGKPTTGWTRLAELLGPDGQAVVARVKGWLGIGPPAGRKGPAAKYVTAYRPFPVELLPDCLDRYVRAAAAALPCDAGYVAPHVLAACAGCIGLSRVLRLKAGKRGWLEPPIIWAAVVAYSGTCKSPAFDVAIDDVQAIETELNQEYAAAMQEYKAELRAYKAADEEGEEPTAPVERRIRVQETTIEALAVTLSQNPKVLLARDELRGWVEGFRKYGRKAGATDLPLWLELHRGNPISVDRKTGDHRKVRVPRAAVSVCGTIQPKVMASAFDADAFDSGCVARILLSMPPRQPKVWSDVEVPDEIVGAYERLLRALVALEPGPPGSGPVPQALSLAPDAQARWKRFVNEWGVKTYRAGGEAAASAYSKLEGYAARFALIFHVVRHVSAGQSDLSPVGLEDLERGIALARWFADEADRVYAVLRDPDDPLRELAEWVARQPGRACTAAQLQRAKGSVYPKSELAEDALQELVDAGYGEWLPRPPGPKGGRPTKEFRLYDPPERRNDETDETPPDRGPDDAGGTDGTADGTPGGGDKTPGNPDGFGVPSVSSFGRPGGADTVGAGRDESCGPGHDGVSSVPPPGPSIDTSFALIQNVADLAAVATAVAQSPLVGLDLETTGLDSRADRARLMALSVGAAGGGRVTYLIDCFAVDPSPLWGPLAGCEVVGHNLGFDLQFLARLGFVPGRVWDTMLLSQVLYAAAHAKGVAPARHTLQECCLRELGVTLAKDLQKSDWSGPLSAEQLEYAAADVGVLVPLHTALAEKVRAAGLDRAAAIEAAALPCVVWMALAGVPFDRACWEGLAAAAQADAGRAKAALDAAAPPKGADLYGPSWNWDSPAQVKQALARAGCPVESTQDAVLAGLGHPLAALLRGYRDARKRETTYGADWLKHVAADGRVYPRWVQLGANSGRMACASPNMQNLPRGDYRRCFAAAPGRVLVKADYSQIELRIAAKVSGDEALVAAYERGEDLHALTARQVLGIADVTKEHRQLAKAVNFGLLYGMGAKGFRAYAKAKYGLDLTEEQAAKYRAAFFRAYPGLRRWHRSVGDGPADTRTLTGRRVLGVGRFNEKLNLPVQGTGADGLKAALGLLWERRAECPAAVPVLAVHDEVVVECDTDQATEAAAWLKRCLVDAMGPLIDPVPVGVDVAVGRTWAGD